MDELAAHSHKYRVPMGERNGRRLQRVYEHDSSLTSPPPVLALTHMSHVATRLPGCSLKETQVKFSILLLLSDFIDITPTSISTYYLVTAALKDVVRARQLQVAF